MRMLLALILATLPLTASAGEAPQPFTRGTWALLRQAHRGRPVVVHFWGMTCGPCLVELPQWGQFARQEHDVDLVLIDADPAPVTLSDIATTLDKAGLGKAESWRFADDFTERLEYEIDPQWHGELPYTLLIGRDGTIEPILGTVDFAQLARWSDRQDPARRTSG